MSDQQPVGPLSDPEAKAQLFLAMIDDLGVGRTNDLPLAGGGVPHNLNLPMPAASGRKKVHSGVDSWKTAVFEACTAADEGKDSIMDGQLYRANKIAAQSQSNQDQHQRGTGSHRGGRGGYGGGRNNMHSRRAIDHANIAQTRRANETNHRVVQLMEQLNKKSAGPKSFQGKKMTHGPNIAPPPKSSRNRQQTHHGFGTVANLAPPDVFMLSVPKVFRRPSTAAPSNADVAIKTQTPVNVETPAKTNKPVKTNTPIKAETPVKTQTHVTVETPVKIETPVNFEDEDLITFPPDVVLPVQENIAVPVEEKSIVGVKKEMAFDPASALASVVGQQPFKGLGASKYVTEEYLAHLKEQKETQEALAQSSLITDAANAEAFSQSSVPHLQSNSTVKPVVKLPMEDEYDYKLTRKWGGKFSKNGSPMQDATIIYFSKEPEGPRTLRLVVSIDGKPVSVFSKIVPKDVPVVRDGGVYVDVGPFIEKDAEGCILKLEILPPTNMNAFLLSVNSDKFRPQKSIVEPEITQKPTAETISSSQATATIETSVANEPETDGSNAEQDGHQEQAPIIFDSCFAQPGVAWLFAGAVENQYEGTFLDYLFKTFNNSSLQVSDAKEAILGSSELIAGADQIIHDFTRSSATFMMMSRMGASGPPPGFGKKVLAEVLAIRDADAKATLSETQKSAASHDKSQIHILEPPALRREPTPRKTSYTTSDLIDLRDNAVEYEKDLLPSTMMQPPSQKGRNQGANSSIPSKKLHYTVPKPAPTQAHGVNVFSSKPSGKIIQAPTSSAPVATNAQGPKPTTLTNNPALAAKYSGADTGLESVLSFSIAKKEEPEESYHEIFAKLPKLGASKYADVPQSAPANIPSPATLSTPASRPSPVTRPIDSQPNTPDELDSVRQEHLKVAKQLSGEFKSNSKSSQHRKNADALPINQRQLFQAQSRAYPLSRR